MLVAGLLLSYDPTAPLLLSVHAFAVIAACLLWALDNNVTRKISGSDPITIAMVKGLVAGSVNLAAALALGEPLPGGWQTTGAMTLGLLSYGVSLVLFVYALRHLGSARTSAHFSTAPFFGAALAIALLHEPVTLSFAIAFGLMLIGTLMVLSERHAHKHTHEHLGHSHLHRHDLHHQHHHDSADGPEPHTHWHMHDPLTHSHAHLPDLHHRHEH